MGDAWNPGQYGRFAAERSLPFRELLELAGDGPARRVVDLGCGPGELTALAARALGAREVVGIDSSPAMLRAAAGHATDRIRFEAGDIATWTSDADVDVLIAAASLQWVPDHPTVLARWARGVAPGGQLLVQVPANAHAPTHTVAAAVAEREPFRSAFGAAGPPIDPVAVNVLAPEEYARILYDIGFADQKVFLRVYPHVLESTRDAVEWVKGTTLTRFAQRLPTDLYERFVEEYTRELVAVLGEHSPLFFPFSRILFWARR